MHRRDLVLLTATFILTLPLGACGTEINSSNDSATGGAGVGGSSTTTGAISTAGAGGQKPVVGQGGQTATTTVGAGGSVSGASGAGASGATASAAGNGAAAGKGAAGTGTAGKAGSGSGKAGAGGAAGAAGSAQSECQKTLKSKCEIYDTSACGSFLTMAVYKSDAVQVKAEEYQLGPYGAIMETNLGREFAVPEYSGEASCAVAAASFGEPADVTADLLDLRGSDLTLYTVYRPACMKEGEKYPVITWANGTCGSTEGYGGLLRYVASYGYIVVATNSRYTGVGTPMLTALDFAKSINEDSKSVYYHRLDMDKIGGMGHSQGGGATVTAASDPRIKAVIIWNAATSAVKPFLAVSGDNDLFGFTPASMASAANGAAQPGSWLYFHKVPMTGSVSGHLTLMIQSGRVVQAATAWWDYILKGKAEAGKMFLGTDCGLCKSPEDYEYGHNSLLK
jgi:hypothetical protein